MPKYSAPAPPVLTLEYLPASDQVDPPEGFPARSEITLMPFDAADALKNAEANKARFSDIFGG